MKKIAILILAFTVFFAFSQEDDKYSIKNISINGANNESFTTFYGSNIVFSSIVNNRLHLYKGAVVNDDVKKKSLFFKSGSYESEPVFTKNLRTMYFSRSNDDDTTDKYKKKIKRIGIYKVTRLSNGSWAKSKAMPFNSDTYDVGSPALSRDNKKLYFSSNMRGSLGQTDIFVVDILGNNTYSEPRNLGASINSNAYELHLSVSQDNKLYFTSNRKGGFGGMDIYVADLNTLNVKAKILPSPINSTKDDFSYIYNVVTKKGFFSSNRIGGKGGDDIYSFQKDEEENIKKECTKKISGTIYLSKNQRTAGNTLVKLKNSNNKVLKTFKTAKNAQYSFNLNCEKTYYIEVSKPNYELAEGEIKATSTSKTIKKNLFLDTKLKKGEKRSYVMTGSIDFDYNKWKLEKTYAYELDKAAVMMKKNSRLVIYFDSHTDSRAGTEFNMNLSKKRIEILKEYLGFKGIFRKRIIGKAHGESKPLNKCVKGVRCTDDEYLENRRTTFIVKKRR